MNPSKTLRSPLVTQHERTMGKELERKFIQIFLAAALNPNTDSSVWRRAIATLVELRERKTCTSSKISAKSESESWEEEWLRIFGGSAS